MLFRSNGRAIAHRTKGTPGITGLSRPRVHIDDAVWHLDVGSSYPGGGEAPKGPSVRRLKWYVSWVQNVINIAFILQKCDIRKLTNIGETLIDSTNGQKGNTEGRLDLL